MIKVIGADYISEINENDNFYHFHHNIETQEKMGQIDMVKNQRLPKRTNINAIPWDVFYQNVNDNMDYKEREDITTQNNISYTREQYEKMGITIAGEYDDLFWDVTLPAGWEIKATDHSMWNELFDDKGRKRASFFYKAAFYDRDAFINFDTRFHLRVDHIADYSEDYEIWKNSDYQGVVMDLDKSIYSTKSIPATGSFNKDEKVKDTLQADIENFMKEHYPDYESIHAYWD